MAENQANIDENSEKRATADSADTPSSSTNKNRDSIPTVCVDGACRDNGKSTAQGGSGVYWGDYHPLNTSERLIGEKQTNNRAELSAAIIAIAQADTIGLTTIDIHTDSKYVKEGITKWTLKWRVNDWKTTGGKDVLNKDLWVLLIDMVETVEVNWFWVQAHSTNLGNIRADELAKSGICANTSFWQNKAMTTPHNVVSTSTATHVPTEVDIKPTTVSKYKIPEKSKMTTRHAANSQTQTTDVCPDVDFTDTDNVSNTFKTITQIKEGMCTFCDRVSTEEDNCIECSDCKSWCHYNCTGLPTYQLRVFETMNRKYSCLRCSVKYYNAEDDEENNPVTNSTTEQTYVSSAIQTHLISVPVGTQTKCVVTQEHATQTYPIKSTTENSTSENRNQAEAENNFMQHSLNMMEKSFVSAIEKITVKNSEMETLKLEISRLQNHLNKKDTMLNDLKQHTNTAKDEECKECKSLYAELQKEKSENSKLKQDKHNLYLEKELQAAKLMTDIKTSHLQTECHKRNADMLNEELKMRDKREINKNEVILRLEDTLKEQAIELLRLHDEYISFKVHESRQYDFPTAPQNDNIPKTIVNANKMIVKGDQQEMKEMPSHVSETMNSNNMIEGFVSKSVNIGSTKSNDSKEDVQMERKHEVEFIGTSNIRYISKRFLEEDEFHVEKTTKYTTDETKKHIKNSNTKDTYILHSLCNDAEKRTEEECVNGIEETVLAISKKKKDAKVIISLGLPRFDKKLNRKIERINNNIKEKFADSHHVKICDNSNLFYKGEAYRGVLERDGLHLSKLGTNMLSKNIKASLMKALNIRHSNYEQQPRSKVGRYNNDSYNNVRNGWR